MSKTPMTDMSQILLKSSYKKIICIYDKMQNTLCPTEIKIPRILIVTVCRNSKQINENDTNIIRKFI